MKKSTVQFIAGTFSLCVAAFVWVVMPDEFFNLKVALTALNGILGIYNLVMSMIDYNNGE